MRRHPLRHDRAFLQRQARLPEEIRPGPAARLGGGLLLTGATGFIGAHLLPLLARQRRVTCLVRAADEAAARLRLTGAAHRYGLPAPGPEVEVVLGDLGEPDLGLSPEVRERLAAELSEIVHYGATGSWFAPYERLAAVDIGGLIALLRLATEVRQKRLCYAGSLASMASLSLPACSEIREEDRLRAPETLVGGYCQGKWVAEQLLDEAGRRGLPVSIHRLGDVKGPRAQGVGNVEDFGHRLIAACLDLGVAPRMPGYRVHYLPVDEVAEAVAALVASPEATGKSFQLASPTVPTWDTLLEIIEDLGRPLRRVDPDTFGRLLRAHPVHRAAAPVFRRLKLAKGEPRLSFLDLGLRLYSHAHRAQNTASVLGHGGIRGLDRAYLARLVRGLYSRPTSCSESVQRRSAAALSTA